MRIVSLKRETNETKIDLKLNLDGSGKSKIDTGIGFFNHMLTLFSFHSNIDLDLKVIGDLEVDSHHTIEDVGILLGKAIKEALGDKKGIARYGFFKLPMDETLMEVTLDLSGRSYLVFNLNIPCERLGNYDTEMTEEFFRSLAYNLDLTLHINMIYGKNSHHIIEATFKAFGRSIKEAIKVVDDGKIISSKGVLE